MLRTRFTFRKTPVGWPRPRSPAKADPTPVPAGGAQSCIAPGTVQPDTARYSPAQPGTARHSPVQPGAARHSPVQSGTTRHGAARRGAGAPRCARASPPRQEPPGSVSRRLLAKLPRCLGLGSPVPPPLPRGKSPAPPINFLMSREPGKGSQQHGLNPLTPHPRIPTGTPMTDLFTVIVLPDNARFPRNFGSLGCILFGNIFENAPSAPRFSQS